MAGRRIDTTNEYLGAEREFSIEEVRTIDPDVEVVDRVMNGDAVDMEKFMNEKLTVMVHDSTDPNDTDYVLVAVNGVNQYFRRGHPQSVRRCFVERLARAKRTAYSQRLDDIRDEGIVNYMRPHHALRYPFSVIEDPNPKGGPWLRNLLAERQ